MDRPNQRNLKFEPLLMKVTVTKKSKTVMKVHDPLNPIMRFKIDPRANRLSPIKAKF